MIHLRGCGGIIGDIRDRLLRGIHADRRISSLSTAHHEAGHAVAAVVLGIGLDRVSIVDDPDVSGRIVLSQEWPRYGPGFDPHKPEDRRVAERWILLALVGEYADADCSGRFADFRNPGATWDWDCAEALAEPLFEDLLARETFLQDMKRRAERFVTEPLRRRQICAVAASLGGLRELDGRQVARIMDEAAMSIDP